MQFEGIQDDRQEIRLDTAPMKKEQGVIKGDASHQERSLGNKSSYNGKDGIIFLGCLVDVAAWSSVFYLQSLTPL